MPDVTPPGGGLDQSDILSDGTPFAGSDVGETLSELQSGRTRELLLLSQDKPVPEVVDPLNIQTGLSEAYKTSSGDYLIDTIASSNTIQSFPSGNNFLAASNRRGLAVNPNADIKIGGKLDNGGSGIDHTLYLTDSSGNVLESKGPYRPDETFQFDTVISAGVTYYVVADFGGASDSVIYGTNPSYPYTSNIFDITAGVEGSSTTSDRTYHFDELTANEISNSAKVTDKFSAPTTAPADFKQWNAIRAEDVTTGGSTSAEPVEFEILDSTDTALNSVRIPKARIADEPFTMRNRVYSESAGSDGQSDFTIATTGDGGHFGIPILTVVSVKKNGSVLDSANWSFDDVDTVTIDTSNVSIASGDTIDIKYDFDVFDSTLQPRAHLSREDTSEDSPSISHFRYEYVI